MRKKVVSLAFLLSLFAFHVYGGPARHHVPQKTEQAAVSGLDINTATQNDFQQLKGIGEKKAQAIINYRVAHGNFKAVDDLAQVHGIGPKLLEKIEKENPGKLTVSQG